MIDTKNKAEQPKAEQLSSFFKLCFATKGRMIENQERSFLC